MVPGAVLAGQTIEWKGLLFKRSILVINKSIGAGSDPKDRGWRRCSYLPTR